MNSPTAPGAPSLLSVRELGISYPGSAGGVSVVEDLSFALDAGATLGIVGESGSGKSQTALAILGLLPRQAQVSGSVRFGGEELLGLPRARLDDIRGARIGIVFQDPMSSLNPHLSIGTQLAEVLIRHRGSSRAAALAKSARMLDAVRISDARGRLAQYPHELSGGMRQRVTIAMALLCKPELLIADEPTTALDVTVQAEVLELLDELRLALGLALVLITHDLGVVSESCERTLVMYAGRAVEYGATAALLHDPVHPYTRGLLAARPRLDAPRPARLRAIPGAPPDRGAQATGCPFAPRCEHVLAICRTMVPPEIAAQDGRRYACHAPPGRNTAAADDPALIR